MEFNERLHKKRVQEGKTLEQVANIVGVSKATIQRWETGEIKSPKSDKIEKLAIALNTTPTYLMGLEDNAKISYQLKNDNYGTNMLKAMNEYPEVPVALSAPQGYDNLTDEQKELIQSLIDKYNEKNIGNK